MQAVPVRYAVYMDSGHFEQLQVLRQLGPWSIEAALFRQRTYFLVAVNHEARTVLGWSYEGADEEEFANDATSLQSIPPDDTGGAGVLAPLAPFPPSRRPGYREAVPHQAELDRPNVCLAVQTVLSSKRG